MGPGSASVLHLTAVRLIHHRARCGWRGGWIGSLSLDRATKKAATCTQRRDELPATPGDVHVLQQGRQTLGAKPCCVAPVIGEEVRSRSRYILVGESSHSRPSADDCFSFHLIIIKMKRSTAGHRQNGRERHDSPLAAASICTLHPSPGGGHADDDDDTTMGRSAVRGTTSLADTSATRPHTSLSTTRVVPAAAPSHSLLARPSRCTT